MQQWSEDQCRPSTDPQRRITNKNKLHWWPSFNNDLFCIQAGNWHYWIHHSSSTSLNDLDFSDLDESEFDLVTGIKGNYNLTKQANLLLCCSAQLNITLSGCSAVRTKDTKKHGVTSQRHRLSAQIHSTIYSLTHQTLSDFDCSLASFTIYSRQVLVQEQQFCGG